MFQRHCIGMILGASLLAAQPAPGAKVQTRTQAWVLALDERGGLVGDLKPEEIQVKVAGKARPLVQVKTPAQTAEAAQSWVLVFEPIRDPGYRATAFVAAADFLSKVPDGDRVLIVARGKDSLEALMPGFSLRRALWAETLAELPDFLPETFVGVSKESLQGQAFQAAFTDASDGPAGQEAVTGLLAKYRAGATGWAKGTTDIRGVRVVDRLNLDNPMLVAGMLATVGRETKVLLSLFDQVAAVPGQKHVVVFSRCEADDLSSPEIRKAMSTKFKRIKGDSGGPAEAAVLIHRDMIIYQNQLKERAVVDGLTVYSVAGTGQNVIGHLGNVAPGTGGYIFPLSSGLELSFGQGIQLFGSRYLVQWQEDAPPADPAEVALSTSRKGVKLIAQALR